MRELVETDQVIGAVWQLTDVVEVLIRLPAIVMACDVIVHSSDGNDLAGAIDDYSRAITLLEDLRTRLEPAGQWRANWQNTLNSARYNRRITLETGSKRGPLLPGSERSHPRQLSPIAGRAESPRQEFGLTIG